MILEKEIVNAIEKELGIKCFYLTKKNYKAKDYVIFSYSEVPNKFADNEEYLTKYLVFINLYTTDSLKERKNNLIKAMKELGYIKKTIPSAFWEEQLGVYNQAFQFVKIIESEV